MIIFDFIFNTLFIGGDGRHWPPSRPGAIFKIGVNLIIIIHMIIIIINIVIIIIIIAIVIIIIIINIYCDGMFLTCSSR